MKTIDWWRLQVSVHASPWHRELFLVLRCAVNETLLLTNDSTQKGASSKARNWKACRQLLRYKSPSEAGIHLEGQSIIIKRDSYDFLHASVESEAIKAEIGPGRFMQIVAQAK